jgi:hypothetical protein
MTRLLAIPGYSKLWLMNPASPSILIEKLYFRGHVWDVKVNLCGFNKGVPDSVAVLVSATTLRHSASGTIIDIEILDDTWEHTVFHEKEILGNDTWFKYLIVKRSELEAASCVHNDNIPVRCTLSFVVEQKKKLPPAAAAVNWWKRFRKKMRPHLPVAEVGKEVTDQASWEVSYISIMNMILIYDTTPQCIVSCIVS